jgi:transposase InsO family protein
MGFSISIKLMKSITYSNHLLREQEWDLTEIKKVRSDDENEFRNSRVDELCDDLGIKQEISAKYTPQSNVHIKMKNRTLIDIARYMLSE